VKVLALSSSPRTDGNSRLLAQSVLHGARSRGHDTDLVDLCDMVTMPLRDCRTCRRADGTCSIADRHHALLRDQVLPADALVFATPLYWYGISGQLKIFMDRIICHTRADQPDSADVKRRLMNKRAAVVVSSEENYPGVLVGLTAQMQEFARYLGHELVGVVHGIANSRGEIARDPAGPLDRAFDLGTRLFAGPVTDYRMDTVRAGVIWPEPATEAEPTPTPT
jgi:multimeric flavodoxin WrbA